MRTNSIITALSTVVLALAVAVPAQGAITVGNTNDSGPGSLRQAIESAPSGETINVPAGTYTITSEELVVTKALTIAGHEAGDTVIRAGAQIGVFVLIGAVPVEISNVTIRDGNLVGSSPSGAGIVSAGPNLTLRGVVLTNNTVNANGALGVAGGNAQGGGLLVAGGTLSMSDSRVVNNTATAVGGSGAEGGDATGAGALIVAPYTISNSTFSNNIADARGGQGPSDPEQDGGEIEGTGLFLVTTDQATSLTGVTVANNFADASSGSGGEEGDVAGGGLFDVSQGPNAFSNTTVAGNVARATGTADEVTGAGAFLVTVPGKGLISFSSSTIAANRGEGPEVGGGNVFAVGPTTFANSIVSAGGGTAGIENCFAPTGEVSSLGFNIDSTDQCGFHANGDKFNADPLLGPLAANGGLVETMLPAANSPAVDQGSRFGLATDARGVVRPLDLPSIPNSAAPGADGSDIGAAELQPSNSFAFGKLKKNKKKGTATLTVSLSTPSAGTLVLSGKGLKKQTKTIAGEIILKLKVIPKGKVKKALRKKGKRKVGIKVTYTPTGNTEATKTKKAKLVKKKKKKRKK